MKRYTQKSGRPSQGEALLAPRPSYLCGAPGFQSSLRHKDSERDTLSPGAPQRSLFEGRGRG